MILRRAGVPASEIIPGLHRLRALMITLNAHAGAGTTDHTLLGNWRTDSMPTTYMAHARETPFARTWPNRRLIESVREAWRPEYEGASSAKSGGPVCEIG